MSRIGVAAILVFVVACGGKSPGAQGECGDGVVDAGESCDQGTLNGTFGVGCTATCAFACVDPATDCDAPLPCQVAICTTDYLCGFTADTSQDGMTCGTNQVCANGACGSSGVCGNGIVDGTEACDFGTGNGAGTGCEDDCSLSCATATDCDDANTCNGVETCDPVTVSGHTGQKCNFGSPASNGVSCGTGMICLNEACTAGVCGDSYTAGTEECDDANAITNDGCESNCTYSCVSSDATRNCTPADACAGQGTCNDGTHVCSPGTALPNNTPCGSGGYCMTGVCTQPVCGNGIVEPNEMCDDGAANNGTPSSGCKSDCTYVCVTAATDCPTAPACQMYQCATDHRCEAVADLAANGTTCSTNQTCNNGVCGSSTCTTVPNSCDDGNACNGAETCTGSQCASGTPLADNTSCGTGKICKTQACVNSVCGDSYIDSSIGETCEPPNTATCDSLCHQKVCGDGVRAGTEQCDDGNLTNLDGCDSGCKFEQSHRVNDLKVAFNTTTYCTANALGTAAGSAAQSLITDAIDSGIADGSITITFHALNLADLSGTNEAALQLGVLGGSPAAGTGYNGATADLDWWYTADPTTINASRVPTSTVAATITNKILDVAGPENMKFTVNFVGVDVTMDLFGVKMRGTVNGVSTPTASAGTTPGHLASEHLDPALQSFTTIGAGTNASDRMQLCGNATARSLDNTLVPSSVLAYCSQYTTSNTLLDLYVSGCKYLGFITVVKATQPDASRDGATYVFQADASKNVVSCTRNGVAATLSTCLDNAGYTSLFRMRTGRVIAK